MFNSMFDELKEVKYFKEIKRLESLQKAEVYLEPKWISMMELFGGYTFKIKAPSEIFDWVVYRLPKILKFSKEG